MADAGLFDFLFKECWGRGIVQNAADASGATSAALEVLGEVFLTSEKLQSTLREAGEAGSISWVTTLARALRRCHDLYRHPQPYLRDYNKDLDAVCQSVYDKSVLLAAQVQDISDGDTLIVPCRLMASLNSLRVVLLNVIKNGGKFSLIVTDLSSESEGYRDRVRGAFGISQVGPQSNFVTHAVSPCTHWTVHHDHFLCHSAFWVLLLALGSIPHSRIFYNLYCVLLPGVAERIYPSSLIATPPGPFASTALSAWTLATLNINVLCEDLARRFQRPLLTLPAIVSLHIWDILNVHLQQVIVAGQEQRVPSRVVNSISTVATFMARALCLEVNKWQTPLSNEQLNGLKSRTLAVADGLAKTRHKFEFLSTPLAENGVSPEASPASCTPRGVQLIHFCQFPLMGMLSVARHCFISDATGSLLGGGMTNRPDLSTVIPQTDLVSSQQLVKSLDRLVRCLEAIELQRQFARHHVWLTLTLIEEACIKTIPPSCLTGVWPFKDLTASCKLGVVRCIREILRHLALAIARLHALGVPPLETVGVEASSMILAASLLVLQDVCLRQLPVDSLCPFTIVYAGFDSPRKNRSMEWKGAFCFDLHGFADHSALVPVLKPELLFFRLLVLDYLSKQNEMRLDGHAKNRELFAFELIGPAFGDNEVKFWLLLSNVIGFHASRSTDDQHGLIHELFDNEDSHIYSIVPEWHILRDSVFIAKYLINNTKTTATRMYSFNSSIPRWKPGKSSQETTHTFRVSFLQKAGRNVTACVLAKFRDTGINHFAPAIKETAAPGVYTFANIQADLKRFWASEAKARNIPLARAKESAPNSSFATFTAISKYIQGFWDSQDETHCTPSTSLLTGNVLSEESPVPCGALTGVEQNNAEGAWQSLTSKIAETIKTETDILIMKAIPLLDKHLSHWDIEVLFQLLSAPMLRIPALISFFNHSERMLALASNRIQHILWIALFEPGNWKNRQIKQQSHSKVLLPMTFPSIDEWDEKFWLSTRMGWLMNEICFNVEGLVSSLIDILRHASDKDNGKMDLSENESLKALTFLTSVSCKVVQFMHFVSNLADLEVLGIGHFWSEGEFRVSVRRMSSMLMKVLVSEMQPTYQGILDKATTQKKIQLIAFVRSFLAEIQEVYFAESVRAQSSLNSAALATPQLEYLSPSEPTFHLESPSSTFQGVSPPLYSSPANSPETSRGNDKAVSKGAAPPQPVVHSCGESGNDTLLSISRNLYYVLAHRNFCHTNAVFGGSIEDEKVGREEAAASDSEESATGSHTGGDRKEASVESGGLAVYQVFLLLSRIRAAIVKLCESRLEPWGDGYAKSFVPAENEAIVKQRSQLCDEILKCIIGSEDPESAVDTNVLGSWKRSMACGWPSDMDALEGTSCGRYIRSPTVKSDSQTPAVEIDFQLGEVSFLSRGFQTLGDWVYRHKLFEDIVCGGGSRTEKHPLFHCAVLLSTSQLTHYRLIGLQDFDVVRFAAVTHPIVHSEQMDMSLATRQNRRESLLADVEGLRSQLASNPKKSTESTLKKELRQKLGTLEQLVQHCNGNESFVTPAFFLSCLWDGNDPVPLYKWKSRSFLEKFPFFECGKSGSSPQLVRRFVSFVESVSRDVFVPLPSSTQIKPSNIHEIVYYVATELIEVYKFEHRGCRLFRYCVYSSRAAQSLCTSHIREHEKFTDLVWAPGSVTVSNVFAGLTQPVEGTIAVWGRPISRADNDALAETIWILKPVQEGGFGSRLFSAEDYDEDPSAMASGVKPNADQNLQNYLPQLLQLSETLAWINRKTTPMAMCLDKQMLQGLLPACLIESYEWWQRLPRLSTGLEFLLKRETGVHLRPRIHSVLIHCLQSRPFCELLALLEEPFSEIFSSPLKVSNSAEKDQITIFLPFAKFEGRSNCTWNSSKVLTPMWTQMNSGGLSVNLQRFMESPSDGFGIVQRSLPGSDAKLTLLNPQALLASGENQCVVESILKMDDVSSVRFWTLAFPDIAATKDKVREALRRRLSVYLLSQSLAGGDTPLASETSPFRQQRRESCDLCDAARLLLNETADMFRERSGLSPGGDVRIDLIELPRLGLTFKSELLLSNRKSGVQPAVGDPKLYSEQHDGFFLSRRRIPPGSLTGKLLGNLTEVGVLLECPSGEFQLLVSGRFLPWLPQPLQPLRTAVSPVPCLPATVPLGHSEAWDLFGVGSISPHFVYQIHSSRCFLYSGDGRSLLVLFLLRLAANEFEAASRLLRSGSLLQYCRQSISRGVAPTDFVWLALSKLSHTADGGHPDGIGCRLKALVAFGAMGNVFDLEDRNMFTKMAADLRRSVLPAVEGDCVSTGSATQVLGWDSSQLYESYIQVHHYCAEVCRLSLKDEATILHYFLAQRTTISSLAETRLKVVRKALKGIHSVRLELFPKPLPPPRCVFDSVSQTAALSQAEGGKAGVRLWDNVQKIQGFVLTYRRPSAPLFGVAAVEYVCRLLLSKSSSSWADFALAASARTPVTYSDISLSLSRDWLLLYDLLTEGLSLSVTAGEDSFVWGSLLCRFVSAADLKVPSRMAGCLKFLATNKSFAISIAPKYEPGEPGAAPDAKDAMSRVTTVTSRFGVTLRSEGPFKTLMEKLDEVLVSLPQTPPQIARSSEPPPEISDFRSVELKGDDVRRALGCSLEGIGFGGSRRCMKRRQLGTTRNTDAGDTETSLQWIQPLAWANVCRMVPSCNKSADFPEFELSFNSNSEDRAFPLQHLTQDVRVWAKKIREQTEVPKLVFLMEETAAVIMSPAKTQQLAGYLDQLRALLASRFLNDGKDVDLQTRDLMASTTETAGAQEDIVPRRVLRACGLEQSLTIENIIELLLMEDGSDWLAAHMGQNLPEAEAILEKLTRLMFLVNRRSQTAYCLACLSNICTLVKAAGDCVPEQQASLAARIDFHIDELVSSLRSCCWYVHEAGRSGCACATLARSDGAKDFICYDPQYLVFEFANGIRLRKNQVELVDRISNTVASTPLCVQLMMGQGKTTVIGPLLATLLATPSRLVVQVVPNNLVHFTQRSLEQRFAAVLKRPVAVLHFNRYSPVTAELVENLLNLQETRGVLVCSPTTIKSIFLKFVLLLSFLWNEPFVRESLGAEQTVWRVQRQKALRSLSAFSKSLSAKGQHVAVSLKVPLGQAATQLRSVFQMDRNAEGKRISNRTLFGDIKSVMGKVGKMKFSTMPSPSPSSTVSTRKPSTPGKRREPMERELRETPSLLRSEFLVCHRLFKVFEESVLIMDEVDTVMHPQKSELRWPVGTPCPVDLSDSNALPLASKKVKLFAQENPVVSSRLVEGARQINGLRWRLGWHYLELVFIGLQQKNSAEHDLTQCCVCFDEKTSFMALESETKSIIRCFRESIREGVKLKYCLTAPHFVLLGKKFYREKLQRLFARWMAVLLSYLGFPGFRFEEVLTVLICPKDSISAKWKDNSLRSEALQAVNLSRTWVRRLGPYVLSCLHRVQYGLLRSEELAQSKEQAALSRQLLAVPFIGKDTPSESSEFANTDVLIGFTVLAYRLEGMREKDVKLTVENLKAQLRLEQSRLAPGKGSDEEENRLPAAETYAQWIEAAGGRVKGLRRSKLNEENALISESVICVMPLENVDLNDWVNFKAIENLLLRSKLAIAYFLFNLAFPLTLKSSPYQLVASGQHLGSYSLFKRKIGFSGTPSSLLPPEFGECQFEEGSDGQMFSMLVSSDVTCCGELPVDWTPQIILEIAAGRKQCALPLQKYHALIDVGALVTGYSNEESSVILNESLDEDFVGVMFFGEGDRKMLMNKNLGGLRNMIQQDNSDIIPSRRFTFYDHTHSYGQDVSQDPLAVALITVGKDTNFRDLAQGAWRLRQLGRGQRVHLVVPPEIAANMRRRRLLWKTREEPSLVERAINWCLWNSEKQYKRLNQLTSKQSCEHLVASVIIRTALSMESSTLINGPVAPITQRLQELCVEGSRNELPISLTAKHLSWRESIRSLMTKHSDLWCHSVITSYIRSEELQRKAEMIRGELKRLDDNQLQHLLKKESAKLNDSRNALAVVFESKASLLDDEDSSVSSFEDNELLDAEIEAEAEEEIEEEEEQEEEVEKEEEHEIINTDNSVIQGLRYSKSKEAPVHWNLFALRDSIAQGRILDPASNQVIFRAVTECGLSTKSSSPLRLELSPSVWCTHNFHPQSWDSSVRRLRNVLFVLEVAVTNLNEEANAENSVIFQLLFQSFLGSSSKTLTNSQFYLLLSLLGILDRTSISTANTSFLAKLKAIVNSLESEKQWTLREAFRILFSTYNLALLAKHNSTVPPSVEIPMPSLFNKSIYQKYVCLTLREAQLVRRLLQECVARKFSFSGIGIRLCLRSTLSNFAVLDFPALEFEEALAVQKHEAFCSLRFLSGAVSLRSRDQICLGDTLARSDETILKMFIYENAWRRRRLQLPNELTSMLASHLTVNSTQESNQIKLLGLFLKDKFQEKSMNSEIFIQELIAVTMKHVPIISPKAEGSGNLLEDSMPTEIEPSVGAVLIWLGLTGLVLSPKRLQNVSILLRTAFNGSTVSVDKVNKLLSNV
eukprot:Gregarina_sp_Poly_1__1914@NODE_14_length_23033_cov_86_212880_g12_i0_p1_GENE_NODE_14_length_23033_cov_86_212880_g12_i0NODE_14_length_23033_cov_86_212880_g12_i0_p1_ORF_typecomplete_len4528_score709_71DUF3638/PF12340_8/3e40DUF3638/PF12340_8/0_00021DUF3645/PF12359_8/4_9e12Nop14/PF04147_12/0_42Cwf_Cwc_15/PF04889_12/20_NODE_14_length_23033_cov_86_212880_g12_i089614479